MHFTPILLASLSAGALAMPTYNSDNTANTTLLAERDASATISSYVTPGCADGKKVPNAASSTMSTKEGSKCMPWNSSGPNVGIQWGPLSQVVAYTDSNCKNLAATVQMSGNQGGVCLDLIAMAKGGYAPTGPGGFAPWGSVIGGSTPK